MSVATLFGPLCIRADASPSIGIGHLMRCLALAQAWQDRGGAVTFVTAPGQPALKARFVSEGFAVHELKAPPGTLTDATETLATATSAGWRVISKQSGVEQPLPRCNSDPCAEPRDTAELPPPVAGA